MNKHGYVYIIGDNVKGPLYIGVTRGLVRRVRKHKNGRVLGLSKKYHLTRLVFFEYCDSIHRTIWRARQIRHWKRPNKLRLIEETNPRWHDLYYRLSDKQLHLSCCSTATSDSQSKLNSRPTR